MILGVASETVYLPYDERIDSAPAFAAVFHRFKQHPAFNGLCRRTFLPKNLQYLDALIGAVLATTCLLVIQRRTLYLLIARDSCVNYCFHSIMGIGIAVLQDPPYSLEYL
jgi:hypothetical protein